MGRSVWKCEVLQFLQLWQLWKIFRYFPGYITAPQHSGRHQRVLIIFLKYGNANVIYLYHNSVYRTHNHKLVYEEKKGLTKSVNLSCFLDVEILMPLHSNCWSICIEEKVLVDYLESPSMSQKATIEYSWSSYLQIS